MKARISERAGGLHRVAGRGVVTGPDTRVAKGSAVE